MRHRGSFDETTLLGLAAATGYDPLKVAEMMKSEEISAHIRQTYEAAEALGIRGTPAFVIGDEIIPGAISKSAMQDAVRAGPGRIDYVRDRRRAMFINQCTGRETV